MRLARQKIDLGLWIGDVRVGVVWGYREIMRHSQCRDCCLCKARLMHDPRRLSCDKTWTSVPFTFSCFKRSYGKAARQADLMGNEIHVDTFFLSSFILSVALRCKLSLSVCALTEVQGNYWNIWMTGPSLYPLTNDAWLLQKGIGRTLLPLTDISHQRSMTTSTLVSCAGGERK